MRENHPSRRKILKASGAIASLVGMPALLRAESKEIVIGGPAGAAKYFNSDLFPFLEKKLDVKILYEGSNSLTNLTRDGLFGHEGRSRKCCGVFTNAT